MLGNADGSTARSHLWHIWQKVMSSNDYISHPLSLYSSSHFTQHAHQPKPFQVQNDGFWKFGVEKFYSHCWYFLQPKSFLEYEWNILLVENICLKKLNYIKAINFRTSMDVSYAHTFSRNEISLRNVLSGEIRCFESRHNVIPSQSLH